MSARRIVDSRPIHQRIAAALREEVLSGELAAGANLPSTLQLTERFGASNATVQKALKLLKEEGLVVGRAGASVSVRQHRQRTIRPADFVAPAPPNESYPWIAKANQRGWQASSRLLEVGEVRPPQDAAAALQLTETGTAVMRRQLLVLDDEPAELVTSYYPTEIAAGTALLEHRKIRGGTPTLLASMGYPPRKCVDHVSARVPTQEQYELLELPSELPILRTFRVVYSDNERPIEATIMAKAGHLYELQYEFS
ncbi:GntR family transcriptional regulator [Nonomuraea sp. NPDC049714]|uniref:GntR family transcriptional regulator n=1 Tax=Nonomuraea sp. NPDC049714 TaxID=3364357 RepID=UPI0037A7122B